MEYKIKKTTEKETKPVDSCYTYVDGLVQDAESNTNKWSTNQEKWFKLRMRVKKSKTFPFVGCSNIRMPTAEIKIRKVKAALMNTIFGIRPIVQVMPSPSGNREVAKKIEKFLDHLIMDVMKLRPTAAIAIDQSIEKGFYLMKPIWRTDVQKRAVEYSLDDLSEEEKLGLYEPDVPLELKIQAAFEKFDIDKKELVYEHNYEAVGKAIAKMMGGATSVTVNLKDVIYDYPDVDLVSPERLYVSSESGWNPQKAQYLIHEYYLPANTLRQNEKLKDWDISGIDNLADYESIDLKGQTDDDTRKLTDTQKDIVEGIDTQSDDNDLVRIWEFYGYYDLKGSGVKEKTVITMAPDSATTLKKDLLPYDSMEYPFIKLFYEITDDRWFAHRGLVEIIEDIIKEIDVQHNQKIDQQTIRNAPMFVYRAGMINPNTVQFMPNQGIPVNGMNPLRDTIDVLNNNNPNVEYSYEREQMLLESKVEEMTGQLDTTLQSMINRREPRTLGEVELQNQSMQNVFSLDVSLYTGQFTELFNWIWNLWSQYGSDDYEFAYFGQDGLETIRLTREEIQGKYKIAVRGNDQNTNPQVKLQKAQQILLATTNPVYLQSQVIGTEQMVAGLKRFYQEMDIPDYEELINSDAKTPPPPPPPPPGADIKVDFDEMTEAEQGQVLKGRGIEPDIVGRKNKKNLELFDKAAELGGQQ